LLSFAEVEERLIEAMLTCWRHPDRERAWLRVKALWPDVQAEPGDHDARGGDMKSSDVPLRPLSATRRDIAEMEEAFGWLAGSDPLDRKLIGLVITARARGVKQVPWIRLLAKLGQSHGADGLRMRYERAMGAVCRAANGSFSPVCAVNPENRHA
jgi:hypothetical protein